MIGRDIENKEKKRIWMTVEGQQQHIENNTIIKTITNTRITLVFYFT